MPFGICLMKQNGQAFSQIRTPSKVGSAKVMPQNSSPSRSQIEPPDRPGPLDLQPHALGLGVELKVERVLDRLGVDPNDPVAGEDPEFIGERSRLDRRDEAGVCGARSTRRWVSGLTMGIE